MFIPVSMVNTFFNWRIFKNILFLYTNSTIILFNIYKIGFIVSLYNNQYKRAKKKLEDRIFERNGSCER